MAARVAAQLALQLAVVNFEPMVLQHLLDLVHVEGANFKGSFSAASKPILAIQYSWEISRRDLHNEQYSPFGKSQDLNCNLKSANNPEHVLPSRIRDYRLSRSAENPAKKKARVSSPLPAHRQAPATKR